ncbi:MAG TPA: hypothetical protein VNI34_09020, partial [Candidatus Nitrosotalea sp.]|nr:hypothetical protein [Candidatus Nitrosotalea sp.]
MGPASIYRIVVILSAWTMLAGIALMVSPASEPPLLTTASAPGQTNAQGLHARLVAAAHPLGGINVAPAFNPTHGYLGPDPEGWFCQGNCLAN